MTDTLAYNILQAGWRDLLALRRLENVCFGPDAWPMLDLIAVLTAPGISRIKAVVGEDLVAFVGGDPRPREGLGWITTIGVAPEYRRMGIATALLDLCEAQMGQPRVRLCVRRSNLSAIHLYELRGYHQVGVWSRYYTGGEDALVLEKTREVVKPITIVGGS